jgi:DNA polymerase III alpha subunit
VPGSLVAYGVGITGVDPVAHGLVFERFLNGRMATAPVICVDVGAEGYGEVVDYAVRRLGGRAVRAGDATAMAELGVEIGGLRALGELRGWGAAELGRVPLDDRAAYGRLAAGQTIELYDLDAGGLLRRLRPERFEDLVAAVALSRRGAGMTERFIAGVAPESEHPAVEEAVASSRGLLLYHEQIMQIAATVAGYGLDEADLLRRALGKGRPDAVAMHRDRFVVAAIRRGVPWVDAVRIFALQRAGPLVFNRGHAVACGLLLYWGAYLRGVLSSPGA